MLEDIIKKYISRIDGITVTKINWIKDFDINTTTSIIHAYKCNINWMNKDCVEYKDFIYTIGKNQILLDIRKEKINHIKNEIHNRRT